MDGSFGDMPVYPCDATIYYNGLTKREYFAGLAMQSIIRYAFDNQLTQGLFETVAKDSIRAADALIHELNKPLP